MCVYWGGGSKLRLEMLHRVCLALEGSMPSWQPQLSAGRTPTARRQGGKPSAGWPGPGPGAEPGVIAPSSRGSVAGRGGLCGRVCWVSPRGP